MLKYIVFVGVWIIIPVRFASAIELTNVRPTVFNFFSDMVGQAFTLICGLCLAGCYRFFVRRHLESNKTIPLKALGQTPNDFFTGIENAFKMNWSMNFVILALLLGINQFSYNIAKWGLDFVTISEEGPLESVVSLDSLTRNPQILMEGVGDPFTLRTLINLAAGYEDNLSEEEKEEYNRQTRMTYDFMHAVDNVAKGISPFLSPDSLFASRERLGSQSAKGWDVPEYGGIPVINIFHARDVEEEAFLVGIDLSLPMDCEDMMVQVEQVQGPDKKQATSKFPGCSFDKLRFTGIYRDDSVISSSNRAEITSHLIHWKETSDSDFSVILDGERDVDAFFLPASSRALARDRSDFRAGRVVDDIIDFNGASVGKIEAIRVGSVSFPVASVVLATGKPLATQESEYGLQHETEYGFIAEIEQGKCPEDPDGVVQPSCLAILNVYCHTFPEDSSEFQVLSEPDDLPLCTLADIEILWGRNFLANRNLAVAVAGVYGRNRATARGIVESVYLTMHLVPAALLLMSSVQELPGQMEVVVPAINGLYIFFMMFPLLLAIIVLICTNLPTKHRKFIIPDEPWKLAVVGNESWTFPNKRPNCTEAFSEENAKLQYGILSQGKVRSQQVALGVILPGVNHGVIPPTPPSPVSHQTPYTVVSTHPTTPAPPSPIRYQPQFAVASNHPTPPTTPSPVQSKTTKKKKKHGGHTVDSGLEQPSRYHVVSAPPLQQPPITRYYVEEMTF